MLRILYDQLIPHIEKLFSNHFELTPYTDEMDLLNKSHHQDILICRSSFPITDETLKNSPIQLVATASSGSEHLHIHNSNIILMNARGGNAHAVTDYITSCLAYLDVSIQQSIAIIGYGFVGQALNRRLRKLGSLPKIYDPFCNFETTWDEVNQSNIILVHPNYHHIAPFATHHLLSSHFFQRLSNQSILINASRGKILDENALIESKWKGIFCTDVYQNEPIVNPLILKRSSICTPHIAGHSIEAKLRISEILSQKIHQHFNLPVPIDQDKKRMTLAIKNWKQETLNVYNPINETNFLKIHYQKEDFIHLRKSHLRHEFEFD